VYCAGIAGGIVGVSWGGGAVRATVGKGTGRSTDVDSDLNPAAGFTELPFATRNAPAVPEVALVCSALPRSAHGASACTGTGLTPGHICTGTGLTAATSASGLGSPLPHLHRDSARRCHICTATRLTSSETGGGGGGGGSEPSPWACSSSSTSIWSSSRGVGASFSRATLAAMQRCMRTRVLLHIDSVTGRTDSAGGRVWSGGGGTAQA
jgi:hypothetical protein